MSAVTLDRPTAKTHVASDARISFWRLTRLEIRKAVDTRAGFWLVLGIVGAAIATAVITVVVGDGPQRDLRQVLSNTIQPVSLLLPVVGVLLVSSEWSQRTNVVTFALVPQRGRVLAAKFAAALLMSVSALLISRLVSELAVLASGGEQNVPIAQLGQDYLYVATATVSGVAFGAVFLASAPAIVLYYLLPTLLGALGSLSVFDGVAPWVDQTRALDPMPDTLMSATQWAHAGTALALWMVLPAVIGVRRVLRADVG